MNPAIKGTIKSVSSSGFGYFIPEENPDIDVFFHARDLVGTPFDDLQVGDKVTCEEVVRNPRGYQAKSVVLENCG